MNPRILNYSKVILRSPPRTRSINLFSIGRNTNVGKDYKLTDSLKPEEKTLEWEGIAPKIAASPAQGYQDDKPNTSNPQTQPGTPHAHSDIYPNQATGMVTQERDQPKGEDPSMIKGLREGRERLNEHPESKSQESTKQQ
jgi:hypothetical protein